MGLALCGTVVPLSVVVGVGVVAVPAAVCRWGLCTRCPAAGGGLLEVLGLTRGGLAS